jgi:hypothetical protein
MSVLVVSGSYRSTGRVTCSWKWTTSPFICTRCVINLQGVVFGCGLEGMLREVVLCVVVG